MKCPECKDLGMLPIIFPPTSVTCPICQGTGDLPADIRYDPEGGAILHRDRLGRRMILRDEAKALGIDAGELARMEKGFFRKEVKS